MPVIATAKPCFSPLRLKKAIVELQTLSVFRSTPANGER
jgi:hypothetical protein